MNKVIFTATAAILGLTSIAMADRGDRYSRSREASVRYERGNSRGDYHNDRGGHDDRGDRHDRGNSGSSFSFSLGLSSGGYGDRSHFGLGVSRGYSHSPRYSRSAPVYIAPAPVYVAPPVYIAPPPVYYAPSYYPAPVYGGYYSRGSYHRR